GAGAGALGNIQEIARVKQIVLAVVVLKHMRVNGERTIARVNQGVAKVLIRALGAVAGSDAKLMIFVIVTDGIIEVEFFICFGDFRRPEMGAEGRFGSDECVAGELPLGKVGGVKDGKNLTDGMAFG